jgi:hypothetical protein
VDQETLRAWLNTRPREDAVLIAQRAALRVFLLYLPDKDWLAQNRDRKLDLTGRPILRSLLTSGVARKYPASEVRSAATVAANVTATLSASASASAAGSFAAAAAASKASDADAASFAAAAAAAAGAWTEVETDVAILTAGEALDTLPIWLVAVPVWFGERDTRFVEAMQANFGADSFWLRWWEGAKSGEWMNWDLQRDVALIDDAVWTGPREQLTQAIAEVEKIYDLRAQLSALTQAIDEQTQMQNVAGATLAHRGHNQPPELVESFALVDAGEIAIEEGIEAAREELGKSTPEPKRLHAIGAYLLESITHALRYCRALADGFLQAYVSEMGTQAAKWTMRLLGGHLALDLLVRFAKSMVAILPF